MVIRAINRNKSMFDEFIDDVFRNQQFYNFHYNNTSSDYKTESDDDGVTLTINVPGYNKKLIDVSVTDKNLIIEGQPNSGDTEGFKYNFTIGDTLNAEGIEATVVDGVLTVSVPYVEEVKPRKIDVKVK